MIRLRFRFEAEDHHERQGKRKVGKHILWVTVVPNVRPTPKLSSPSQRHHKVSSCPQQVEEAMGGTLSPELTKRSSSMVKAGSKSHSPSASLMSGGSLPMPPHTHGVDLSSFEKQVQDLQKKLASAR